MDVINCAVRMGPPATSPPTFEEKARRDPRLPLLVVLGLLGFGIVFVPAAAFAAPALCIALGVSAGGLFGLRAGATSRHRHQRLRVRHVRDGGGVWAGPGQ
jgi:hypothetical protein